MDKKKKIGEIEVTHYLTPIFEHPGRYPDGYDEEFHRDVSKDQCSTCQRLFGEHTPEEFVEHWEKEGIPYHAKIHRAWSDRKCSICERPFSAHTPAEFCNCWDKLGRPKG